MTQPRALRVGIDVGGTFTDLVATESWSGRIATRKVPSTPREPQRAVIEALTSLLAAYDPRPAIEFLAHSTTVATNALLGQLGLELPRVALVTTDGFRDVIEIGRQNRSEVYNLFVERPRPLVARDDRLTVRERIDYHGNVLIPLDDASVANVCEELRERDVAAVAICLLHSYANDAHERRLAHAVASALPRARVTRSSQVDPQYREYERFSTTVVNAALAPIVEAYLERLIQELHAKNVDACLYVMRSDGGLAAAGQVCTKPAAIVESGPASGAIATAALGQRIRATPALVRHGRNDGKSGDDCGRRRARRVRLRSRRHGAQRTRCQRQRLSCALSVRGFGGGERRWRSDRVDRRRRRAARRAAFGRGRSGTGVLWQIRSADRHRCQRRRGAPASKASTRRRLSDRCVAVARRR
jgi:hypothetical protein